MALAISFIALILLSSAIAFQRMSISGKSRDSSYMRELCLPSCSVKVFRNSRLDTTTAYTALKISSHWYN
uniref:Uncharacterized protein n=2 Tax=Brassica oleracea TaxID=3712 RepID=A0A3P6FQY6_BRAOL|nr:unnamed protein product [Brassica oleracea]